MLAILGLAAITTLPALAISYGSGTYGSCQYSSCSITITTNGSLSLNVTPTPSGACTTQSDTVSVFTDDYSGYTLSVANSNTDTGLNNGASSINVSGASQASPSALTVNTWGYRVDGLGGFGAGPTTANTNVALGSTLFAGIPASNATPATLANTDIAADPTVNTPVWYGVCANTSLKSGLYTSQITYTAITN